LDDFRSGATPIFTLASPDGSMSYSRSLSLHMPISLALCLQLNGMLGASSRVL
jgi:hypothetical protein